MCMAKTPPPSAPVKKKQHWFDFWTEPVTYGLREIALPIPDTLIDEFKRRKKDRKLAKQGKKK